MEIERPKTKKKKKTSSQHHNDDEELENNFNDLSIDFPSIESIEETDLDDLRELQRICDEQKEEVEEVVTDCDEILHNVDEITDNTNDEISETNHEIPSAPTEAIVENVQKIHTISHFQESSKVLYPNLENLQSISAITSMSEKLLSPVAIKPFSPLQIEQLYSNNEIKLVELFEHEFVEKELKDSSLQEHPLYVLLKKFAKARSRLLQNSNKTAAAIKKLDGNYKTIWKIEKKTAAAHGFCSCGKSVRATHDYRFAIFDEDVNSEMERNMKEIQSFSCFNHTKFSQDCALFQRQIEQMLGELMNNKAFQNINKNSPVVLNEDIVILGGNEFDIKQKINELRLYISILFKFYRESLHDKVLITHLQDWITKLVSLQLRIATWQDHIFILFHILRCPVGVGNWAANLIQVPIVTKNYENPFSLVEFQHCVAILSALLLPIKERGSFLENITKDLKPQNPKINKDEDVWILVDSDGEEGSSPSGECIGLKENDLVALLDQIPFEMIFKMITYAEIRNESVDLNLHKITGNHIIRSVAFASKFIGILKQGLSTYDTERYKQFAKRLGRLMKQTLFYVSDLIKLYHTCDEIYKDPDECARIQVEFDELIIRSAHFIYESKKLSLFQYLADFPYEYVSSKSLWRLFYYLHVGDFKVIEDEIDKLDLNVSLNDNDIATDDLFFLLHSFARMALAKGREDWDFVLFITQDLLNIGFIHESTRDYCYNTVKDLISNITCKHPELIAEIFNYLKGNLQQVGTLSSYLFKALPIDKWRPKQEDLETLASWLLNFDFESIESSTARTIFAYMNWNFDENNQLFLPHDIHIRMAHLVCEVYLKHVGESIGSGINETARQIGSAKKTPPSKKEQFSIWCWSMVSVLRLHFMDINKIALIENPNLLIMIPEVETTHVVYQGFSEQKPLPIYLSLLLSQLGHSIPQICHRGFDQLKLLLNDYRHSKVIRCLELMTPLFVNCQSSLYTCESFSNILNMIFTADKSYSKMAKEVMTVDARGAVVTFFANMIQHQLTTYANYGWNSPCEMIKLWTNCLVRLNNWNKDMGVTWVLEIIAQIAYQYPDAWNSMREIMRGSVVKISDTKISKSSGFLTLLTSEEKDILLSPFEDMPTISLMLLELEFENIELNTGLWSELICQLAMNGKQSLSNVFKKVLTTKQLPLFSHTSLVIFKMVKLINLCSRKHFLFPIICQQFFNLYLTRVPITDISDHGVQDKFYDSDVGLMKKLKKTFGEGESYHQKMSTEMTKGSKSQFHSNCAKIFKTFILWLEENQLNKMTQQNIILPPQYDHGKLRQIFHGARAHWTEFIYLPELRSAQKADCNSWLAICLRYTPDLSKYAEKARQNSLDNGDEESCERIKNKIYERLKMSGKPLDAPEMVREPIHIGYIDLSKSTIQLLKNESKILQKFAHNYNMMVSEHKAVDAVYRDSVRYTYINEPCFRMKTASCSRLLDNCQGSTTIKLEFSEMKINEAVRTKLEDNREFFKQMIARNLRAPDMKIVDANFCVNNVIQQLLERYESHLKRGEKEQCDAIMKIVMGFFYEMLKEINEEIQECPVTHELYSTTISKLGSLVQQNNNSEGINLLKLALQRPNLVNLIADLFTPSVSAPENFLSMYKCLVDSYAKRCDPQLLFVLFSKFDITTWLQTHKPKLIDASNLIQLIIRGLELWNFQNSSLLQDLLRCHLVSLFMYRFPEHYGEILQYVLTGFSQQRLKGEILLDLINVLYQQAGCGKLNIEMSLGRMKDEMRNFASKQNFLQYNEIHSTMLMLSHHFYNERLQHGLHGVYPKFSEYCDVLCLLFGSMSHALVAAAIQAYPGIIADQLINWLWPSTSDMFAPWLVPYYPQNMKDAPANWIQQFNTSVLQPWSDVHSDNAGKIIRVFAMCLQYILDMLPASNLLLGNLFIWYDGYFAHKSTPKHVLVPIQTLLMKMPFERFRPGPGHMEGINRILMDFVPDCHLFIGNIFLRIPWTTWLQQNMTSWDFMTCQRVLAILLMTFVKLSYEPKVRESIRILQLLQEANKYPWHLLEYKDVESVLDWFVMSAEPSVILKIPSEHETIDTNLLALLQVAACMKEYQAKENIQPSVLIAKRMAYVRSIVRLLRSCDAKLHQLMSTKNGRDLFNDACGSLLNLIDTCYLNADETQINEVVNLVVTILQGMGSPESTGSLFADGINLWQSTCQTGNIVLCSFLNALKIEKLWTLNTFRVLESSLGNYMRVSELTPTHNPSWPDAYKRFGLNVSFDHQILIDNDLFLSLHFLSYIKLLNLKDDYDRVEFLQNVQTKFALRKTSEETEAKACLCWAFLIMSGGHILMRSTVSKSQLLVIARYFQVNLTQPEGWGEGLLGAIGFKKDDQTNKKKILLRCFSCAIFALFIAPGSQTLASANEFDGAVSELKITLSNKKFSDVRMQGLQAISLIESRKEIMIDQLNDTITKIIRMFYHDSFLNSIEYFYHW